MKRYFSLLIVVVFGLAGMGCGGKASQKSQAIVNLPDLSQVDEVVVPPQDNGNNGQNNDQINDLNADPQLSNESQNAIQDEVIPPPDVQNSCSGMRGGTVVDGEDCSNISSSHIIADQPKQDNSTASSEPTNSNPPPEKPADKPKDQPSSETAAVSIVDVQWDEAAGGLKVDFKVPLALSKDLIVVKNTSTGEAQTMDSKIPSASMSHHMIFSNFNAINDFTLSITLEDGHVVSSKPIRYAFSDVKAILSRNAENLKQYPLIDPTQNNPRQMAMLDWSLHFTGTTSMTNKSKSVEYDSQNKRLIDSMTVYIGGGDNKFTELRSSDGTPADYSNSQTVNLYPANGGNYIQIALNSPIAATSHLKSNVVTIDMGSPFDGVADTVTDVVKNGVTGP